MVVVAMETGPEAVSRSEEVVLVRPLWCTECSHDSKGSALSILSRITQCLRLLGLRITFVGSSTKLPLKGSLRTVWLCELHFCSVLDMCYFFCSDKEEPDAETVTSMLGFQSYWDAAYVDELANFLEHGHAGEVWFLSNNQFSGSLPNLTGMATLNYM
ncbi:hypothetical protein LOK49_LG04G00505 [Camellia lanceoleosa]|uniref:Uncharacterized protein n=1 Tax=Camellia lanceoleosa TaxID=1840588 RepID=A0ACC0HYR4_9ERIC|nr:hypothetical protein LOK49_LG04G00505 [Camellia lanceoleosa]